MEWSGEERREREREGEGCMCRQLLSGVACMSLAQRYPREMLRKTAHDPTIAKARTCNVQIMHGAVSS